MYAQIRAYVFIPPDILITRNLVTSGLILAPIMHNDINNRYGNTA